MMRIVIKNGQEEENGEEEMVMDVDGL